MEFQALTIQDKAWITELLSYENSRSCDFDFANLLLWDCFYRKQALRIGDRLLLRVNRSPEVYYMWPVGRGDFVPAIEALKANAQCLNIPLRIFGLEPEHVKLLQEQYPDEFLVQPLPEHYDYLYLIEKMSTLAGRNLHGKRNHLKRFQESHQWFFEPLTPANLGEAREMIKQWFLSSDMNASDIIDEKYAIDLACQYFDSLELEGGLLRVDGAVAAVTLGNRISSDTFCVHFEKAQKNLEGGYVAINYAFSNYLHKKYPELVYLNREDDLGLEFLRKAKHSYYPDLMVEKYVAVGTRNGASEV